MKRRSLVVLAVLAASALLAYVLLRPAPLQRGAFLVFGGITEVEVRTPDDGAAADALAAIAQILVRDQREWHPWETSDLMRLNAAIEQGQPYIVPPGLAGLFTKFAAFQAVIDAHLGWLAIVMAVNVMIGLAVYLRWVAELFRLPADDPFSVDIETPAVTMISLCAATAAVLSILPSTLFSLAT